MSAEETRLQLVLDLRTEECRQERAKNKEIAEYVRTVFNSTHALYDSAESVLNREYYTGRITLLEAMAQRFGFDLGLPSQKK